MNKALMMCLVFGSLLGSISITAVRGGDDGSRLMTLRFFCGDDSEGASADRRYVFWLNNEPVNYIQRGSVFDVTGYPVRKGRNEIRLEGDPAAENLVRDVKVAAFINDQFSLLENVNGAFVVDHSADYVEKGAPSGDGVKVTDVDASLVRANVHRLLETISRGNRSALALLFKESGQAFSRTLPPGIFSGRNWSSIDFADVGEMVISKGDFLILVHKEMGPGDSPGLLLSMDSGGFSYKLESVQLFCNGAKEIAIYAPDVAPDRGFVFKHQGHQDESRGQSKVP